MNILNAFNNLDTKGILKSKLEVNPNEKDFKTIVAKIKNNDAVVININEPQYPAFIKTLKEFGFKGIAVLTGAIPETEDKELFSGIYDIAFNVPSEFFEKYKSPSSPMAYDAVRLYYEAYKNVGKDPDKIADYLEKINFNGVMGMIKFNEIHESDWGSEVYKIIKFE
jgi:ABC-type branched-subunit amino acid transport system substrate-binding protein